jgi:PhnB protein
MATINPYLNFMGQTEEAFLFYQSVFGGKFDSFQRFSEIPDGDKMPADIQDKIMHVSLPIGQGSYLMGSDTSESLGHKITAGNNLHISINAESKEESDHLFNGLSTGGTITMPLEDTFWGAYFGMFTDKFGVHWMINFDYPQQHS